MANFVSKYSGAQHDEAVRLTGELDGKVTALSEEKIDKQQGTDNANKLLFADASGIVSGLGIGDGLTVEYSGGSGKNIFHGEWESAKWASGVWTPWPEGKSWAGVNELFPVEPSTTYVISKQVAPNATDCNLYVDEFDADGNFIVANYGMQLVNHPTKTYTTGENTAYIALTIYGGGLPAWTDLIPGGLMIEKGSVATEYEPYGSGGARLSVKSDNGDTIPTYWKTHLAQKISAIQQLHKEHGKNCFSFVVMSDMHYGTNLGKRSPLLAKHIMDACAIKYAYELGDISNQGALTTKDAVITECENIEKMLAPIRDRLLVVQGNHDGAWGQLDRDGNGTIEGTEYYCYNLTPGEMHQWLFRKVGLVGDVHFDDSGTAYYVDDTASRVRFIALNCNCLDYDLNDDGSAKYNTMRMYRFTQKQYDFLVDALSTGLDDRWHVVVGAHVPLDGTEGPAWGNSTEMEFKLMRDFLTAFKNKTNFSGSFTGYADNGFDKVTVNVDFTTYKANFIGYFCGHMHNDYHKPAVTYGIDMIGTASDCKQDGMTVGTDTEQSFDVVTVDTKNRKIYCTKIGFGADREISY